uniref:Period circadian clock 2 n=1 Tax=Eptatretus burgeri TaxID=7764 RepID=A0A8C4QV85_EPTBU
MSERTIKPNEPAPNVGGGHRDDSLVAESTAEATFDDDETSREDRPRAGGDAVVAVQRVDKPDNPKQEVLRTLQELRRCTPIHSGTKAKHSTLTSLQYALACVQQVKAYDEYYQLWLDAGGRGASSALPRSEITDLTASCGSGSLDSFAICLSLATGRIICVSGHGAASCLRPGDRFLDLIAPQDAPVFFRAIAPAQLHPWEPPSTTGGRGGANVEERAFYCRIRAGLGRASTVLRFHGAGKECSSTGAASAVVGEGCEDSKGECEGALARCEHLGVRSRDAGAECRGTGTRFLPIRVRPYLVRVQDVDGGVEPVCLALGQRLHSAFTVPRLPTEKRVFMTTHSPSCIFIDVDDRSVPLLGYLPQELVGTPILLYIHPTDRPLLLSVHRKILRQAGQPSTEPPMRLLAKNGASIAVETSWSGFVNPWSRKITLVIGRHRVHTAPHHEDVFATPGEGEEDETDEGWGRLLKGDPSIRELQEQIYTLLQQPVHGNGSSGYCSQGSNGSHEAGGGSSSDSRDAAPATKPSLHRTYPDMHSRKGAVPAANPTSHSRSSTQKTADKPRQEVAWKKLASKVENQESHPVKEAKPKPQALSYQQAVCLQGILRYLDSCQAQSTSSGKRKCHFSSNTDSSQSEENPSAITSPSPIPTLPFATSASPPTTSSPSVHAGLSVSSSMALPTATCPSPSHSHSSSQFPSASPPPPPGHLLATENNDAHQAPHRVGSVSGTSLCSFYSTAVHVGGHGQQGDVHAAAMSIADNVRDCGDGMHQSLPTSLHLLPGCAGATANTDDNNDARLTEGNQTVSTSGVIGPDGPGNVGGSGQLTSALLSAHTLREEKAYLKGLLLQPPWQPSATLIQSSENDAACGAKAETAGVVEPTSGREGDIFTAGESFTQKKVSRTTKMKAKRPKQEQGPVSIKKGPEFVGYSMAVPQSQPHNLATFTSLHCLPHQQILNPLQHIASTQSQTLAASVAVTTAAETSTEEGSTRGNLQDSSPPVCSGFQATYTLYPPPGPSSPFVTPLMAVLLPSLVCPPVSQELGGQFIAHLGPAPVVVNAASPHPQCAQFCFPVAGFPCPSAAPPSPPPASPPPSPHSTSPESLFNQSQCSSPLNLVQMERVRGQRVEPHSGESSSNEDKQQKDSAVPLSEPDMSPSELLDLLREEASRSGSLTSGSGSASGFISSWTVDSISGLDSTSSSGPGQIRLHSNAIQKEMAHEWSFVQNSKGDPELMMSYQMPSRSGEIVLAADRAALCVLDDVQPKFSRAQQKELSATHTWLLHGRLPPAMDLQVCAGCGSAEGGTGDVPLDLDPSDSDLVEVFAPQSSASYSLQSKATTLLPATLPGDAATATFPMSPSTFRPGTPDDDGTKPALNPPDKPSAS